jgi:predicted nuclease of predicted toxin-antitoxin system
MRKRFYKHKLLIDENMYPRQKFPRLNEHFDVKHIVHDLNRDGASDMAVYELAVSQRRIILTQNKKHFQKLVGTKQDAGCIAIPPHWTSIQIDTRLTSILMQYGQSHFAEKLLTLT